MDSFQQIRVVTQSVLESAGYSVVAVSDIGEAIKVISKKKPDLIISEATALSGMGGIGFYNLLKEKEDTRSIPFIFLTSIEPQKLQPLVQKFQDLIIPKPVQQWKPILEQIENLMQSKATEHIATTDESSQSEKSKAAKRTTMPRSSETRTKPTEKLSETKIAKRKDALGETKRLASPNMPKYLEIRMSYSKPLPRRRRAILKSLPSGQSTKNFTLPNAIFDTHKLGSIVAHLFHCFSKSLPIPSAAIQFPSRILAKQGLKEQLRAASTRRESEEILVDLELDVSTEQPDGAELELLEPTEDSPQEPVNPVMISQEFAEEIATEEALVSSIINEARSSAEETSVDEAQAKVSSSIKTEPKPEAADMKTPLPQENALEMLSAESTLPMQSQTLIPETANLEIALGTFNPALEHANPIIQKSCNKYKLGQEQPVFQDAAYLNYGNHIFYSSLPSLLDKKQFFDISQAVAASCSICLQIFGLDTKATHIVITTKQEQIFWIHEEKEEIFAMGIQSKIQEE